MVQEKIHLIIILKCNSKLDKLNLFYKHNYWLLEKSKSFKLELIKIFIYLVNGNCFEGIVDNPL